MNRFIALLLVSCAEVSDAQKANVASDFLEQKACVDRYSTKVDIDACRDAVKAKRDGGR
jgi:hypothetical protein